MVSESSKPMPQEQVLLTGAEKFTVIIPLYFLMFTTCFFQQEWKSVQFQTRHTHTKKGQRSHDSVCVSMRTGCHANHDKHSAVSSHHNSQVATDT